MVQAPPSSDSEDLDDYQDQSEGEDLDEYQYESESEAVLGQSARSLFRQANGNYQLARAALLAYTREDIRYLPPPATLTSNTHGPSCTTPPPRPTMTSHTPTLRRINPSARRTLLRAQSQPPVTRPVTPPPASSPRRPATSSSRRPATSSSRHPPASSSRHPSATNEARLSSEQQPRSTQPPPPSTPGPRGQLKTVIYPLLVSTGMLGYFKIEDAVSHRSNTDVQEILTRIKQDERWLGEASHVDTTFVNPDDPVVIHRPSQDATSNTWYTVTAGRQVGIFTSWDVAGSHTQGISCAVHRSWRTRVEAYRSFQLSIVSGTVRLLPSPHL